MSFNNCIENDLLDTIFINAGVAAKDAAKAFDRLAQASNGFLHTSKDYARASRKAQRIPSNYDDRFTSGVERIYGRRTTSKGPH